MVMVFSAVAAAAIIVYNNPTVHEPSVNYPYAPDENQAILSFPFIRPETPALSRFGVRFTVLKHSFASQNFRLSPDDCIEAIAVDGKSLPEINSTDLRERCFPNSYVLDLAPYLQDQDKADVAVTVIASSGRSGLDVSGAFPGSAVLGLLICMTFFLVALFWEHLKMPSKATVADLRQFAPVIIIFAASAFLFWLGGWGGQEYVPDFGNNGSDMGWRGWTANWDGQWYATIVHRGYFFYPGLESTVVFFPLCPLCAWLLTHLLDWDPITCLLIVSNLSCFAFAIIFYRYCRLRLGDETSARRALLLMFFWPSSYFLHAPYTESTFVLLLALLLLGFQLEWSLGWVIFIAGLAAACRSTGLAGAAAVGWYAWRKLKNRPLPARIALTTLSLVAASWGLWVYMAYLSMKFSEPLAFVVAQKAWSISVGSSLDHLLAALTLAPIRQNFLDCFISPITISNFILNSVLWLTALAFVLIGLFKKWLKGEEIILAVLLLCVPYFLVAPLNTMQSVGRYSLVALPVFTCLSRWLAVRPAWQTGVLIGLSAVLMVLYTALFAQRYSVF